MSSDEDKRLSALELEDKYTPDGEWGEHPEYSREFWREEVANEDTQCGYWEWVFNYIQSED